MNRLKAHQIVLAIISDLEDRAGVGDEIDAIEIDIFDEMVDDLTGQVETMLNVWYND